MSSLNENESSAAPVPEPPSDARQDTAEPETVEAYEPPELVKFEQLGKLIVSGE